MQIPTMRVIQKVNGLEATINVSDYDSDLHVDVSKPQPDAGDPGSDRAHNPVSSGSTPEPATTPEDEEPEKPHRGRPRKAR